MRQVALTNCMDMPMSDVMHALRARQPDLVWLAHAGEVAQWTSQLLAWLWLGQQGMHLGWSLASGVMAVAVWWALRVLCRGSGWAFRSSSAVVGVCGVLTALGVCLPGSLGTGFLAHVSLLVVAAVWGVWSALIETRSQVSTFRSGRLPWQPVLAAGLLGLGWLGLSSAFATQAVAAELGLGDALASTGVSLCLALCTALLYGRDRRPALRARACHSAGFTLVSLLAPSTMGLMMGTLWLGHDWCMGGDWTVGQVVVAHVALMVGLPAMVGSLAIVGKQVRPSDSWSTDRQDFASLSLMALGGLMWLGSSQPYGFLAMFMSSLAWALHCNRSRAASGVEAQISRLTQRGLAIALGPALLVWVGLASPSIGPLAMQSVLACLGGLAGITLAFVSWRSKRQLRKAIG
jgi:hypothetical protein